MGTAASARDLVAMADAFDGPGSPINFWGIGHGSLIGSYVLKMFPEVRASSFSDHHVELKRPARRSSDPGQPSGSCNVLRRRPVSGALLR
ncbi:hypothetical protein LXA43DRAFT_170790 [Ganoderma leucocontextum]|nr:hypothetical protein LXA43DRAFT_170790 [Ganoderma leucocontextum]